MEYADKGDLSQLIKKQKQNNTFLDEDTVLYI